ncbi:C40 family peptidase [Lentimicrobium sp.]|uniref:C40 family peptidase n=1 Tax=Lentimicrobium sp. TaxID=2034841 RepID=UPI0025E9C8BA|nr:C40 family peptidase [Lentimicrobium sp.]
MTGGICYLSLVAVRSAPSETSGMVNQLLFGDLLDIGERHEGWIKITSRHDAYEGWCDEKQITLLSAETMEVLGHSSRKVVTGTTAALTSPGLPSLTVVQGSLLFQLSNGSIAGPGGEYFLSEGDSVNPVLRQPDEIVETAASYLKAPYLWGGRSPFGIDCSGLTQIVFKQKGIKIKRDAWQQASQGQLVNLIEEVIPGDVAFFDNEEGKIVHTGILTGRGTVIHASGEVRIDQVDHHGIFNKSKGKYTHKLRLIRRFTGISQSV